MSARVRELAQQKDWPDPDEEIEAFKDYHLARDSKFADWEAAFRTWLRNAARWKPQRAGQTDRMPTYKPTKKEEQQMTPEQRLENIKRVRGLVNSLSWRRSGRG